MGEVNREYMRIVSSIKNHLVSYPWLKSWRPYFFLFALGFLIYSRTLFFDYTYFDDSTLILDKATVLADVKNVGQLFATDAFFFEREILLPALA